MPSVDVPPGTCWAQAGADILIPHMGLTTKGTIGAATAKTAFKAANSNPFLLSWKPKAATTVAAPPTCPAAA